MIRSAAALALLALLGSGCMCAWWGGANESTAAESAPQNLLDHTATSADGTPIHYLVGGQGEVALVFVHGWLGNADWWRPVLERFRDRYRVVAVDLAGHGLSGRGRADWTVERFTDDVVAVVDQLGLQRTVLIGHALSGAITVEVALRLGPRAEQLVPVGTRDDLTWELTPEVWAELPAELREDLADAPPFLGPGANRPSPSVVRRVVAEALATDPRKAHSMLARAHEFDVQAARRALAIPVHVFRSERDLGPWPMLEDPTAFGNALAQILAAP